MAFPLKLILRRSSKKDLVPFVENMNKRLTTSFYLDTSGSIRKQIAKITDKFCEFGGHSVANFFSEVPLPYSTVLANCAKMANVWELVDIDPYDDREEFLHKAPAGIERIELAIVLNAIVKAYKHMDDDQKKELIGLFRAHGIGLEGLDNLTKDDFTSIVGAISESHLLAYELSSIVAVPIWQKQLGYAMNILTPIDLAKTALKQAAIPAAAVMAGNVLQGIIHKYAMKMAVAQWLHGSTTAGAHLLHVAMSINSVSTPTAAKLAGKAALKGATKGTLVASKGVAGKALGLISGPVAWGIIAAWFSWDLMKPAFRVIFPGIVHICYLRQKLLFTLDLKDTVEIEKAWKSARKIRGKDSEKYRQDPYGSTIYKASYGKSSKMGWKLVDIKSTSKNRSNARNNVQAINTSNIVKSNY